MAVTTYEEDGLVGRVTVATRASTDGIEIAVTVEEQSTSPADSSEPLAPGPTTPGILPGTSPVPHQPVPQPVPLPSAGDLTPGSYFMANPNTGSTQICIPGCADYLQIDFTLPAGWAVRNQLVYKPGDRSGEVAFSVWTVDQVYANPCHWQTGVLPSAPGARDLATRLVHQAGRNASALTPVQLGGQYALRVQLSTPAGLDVSTCDQGEFRSWIGWGVLDGANAHNAPGQVDIVYLVDVDRRPLVIDVSRNPATAEADQAELEVILASMTIER